MRYRGYRSQGIGIVGYIIITCVIVVIAVSLNRALISLLGFHPIDLTQMKQPWTVLTSIFVHEPLQVNPWHVIFNMLVLYFFGGFLVGLLGDKRFLAIYLIGGIVGNLFFMLVNLNFPHQTVIGASGAIFAVEGTLVVMRPRLQVFIFPIPAAIPLWVAVIGAFVLTFFATGVAWEAHLGGLIVGLIAGIYYRLRETRRFF